jgi:hypothetical protein
MQIRIKEGRIIKGNRKIEEKIIIIKKKYGTIITS